jgi:CheY-like chemotaxis protein
MTDPIPATRDRLRVLAAEDDPVSLLLLQGTVERLGHDCVTATDGQAALAAWEQSRPDAVITDWAMPGLDGSDLVRRIRSAGEASYTYVAVLTGAADEAAAREVMHAGADDLLLKPLDPAELERTLIAAGRVTAMHRRLAERTRVDAVTGLPALTQLAHDAPSLRARARRDGAAAWLAVFAVPGRSQLALAAAARTLAAVAPAESVYGVGDGRLAVPFADATPDGAAHELERLRAAAAAPLGADAQVLAALAALVDPDRDVADVVAGAVATLAPGARRERLRVLVADDDPVSRLLLTALVEREPTLEPAGAAEDADSAIALARREHPDVALVDYDMPGGGARAVDAIRAAGRPTRVVAISAHDGPEAMMAMGHAGSVGYLPKGTPDEEIVRVIHSAARW